MENVVNLKPSRFNIILKEQDDFIAFNSINCALTKVNKDFLNILQSPNQPFENEQKELCENMIQMGFLIDNRIDELDLIKLRQLKGSFDTETLTVTILPTDACNFSCFYCFERKNEQRMSKSVQEKTVEFIKTHLGKSKKLKVCWFGGEPLLAKDIIWSLSEKLMDIANEMSCEYHAFMVTNGFIIDDDIVSNLKKYKINTLQITIDGNETEHNLRRFTKTGQATFYQIICNIDKLIANDFKIICRVNIDRNNAGSVKGLLTRLKDKFMDSKSKLQLSFGQILPINRLDEWDVSVCLDDKEYSSCIDEYVEYMINNAFSVPDIYPFYPTPHANFCGGTQINSFVIRPSGIIDKCWDCDTLPVGDVHGGIANSKIYEYNLAKWMTWNPLEDDECRNCRVLPICMGGCPYFALVKKEKKCLKWKIDIENAIRKKYHRYLNG